MLWRYKVNHRSDGSFNDPEPGKFRLLTVNLDGSDEQVLRVAPIESDSAAAVSWSPDGKTITYATFIVGDALSIVRNFDVASHRVRDLATYKDESIGSLSWLPDGQALVALYQRKGPSYDFFGQQGQLGWISRSGGPIQPTTRDINSYATLTLAGDGKTAASVQVRETHYLDLLPVPELSRSASVEPLPQVHDARSIAWAADGKLLVSDGQSLRRLNTSGDVESTLINDPNSLLSEISLCGSYLLLGWWFHGGTNQPTIWRANADGSNLVQLTTGSIAYGAACSRDAKWVYYAGGTAGANSVMRVPLQGGHSEPVITTAQIPGMAFVIGGLAISPDGRQLVFFAGINAGELKPANKLVIVELDSGEKTSLRLMPVDQLVSGCCKLTRDGKAIGYVITDRGVDNIVMQPLDGSPAHQITNFTSDRIVDFQWSPDEKSLAVTRNHSISDVVLLKEK